MTKQNLVIIDYGSGNICSAAKAFEHVDPKLNVIISNKPKDLKKADRIVLPGQGAFKDCMENLQSIDGLIETLEERVLKQGVPFLGICVGMQLLATRGLEHGITAGLNWIEGEVVPMPLEDKTLKLPHMGWNELHFLSGSSEQDNRHFVLRSTETSENFYFVHSFVFKCTYNHNCLALVDYGGMHPAVVGRDNIFGTQFHPEKSHKAGLKLLSQFLEWHP